MTNLCYENLRNLKINEQLQNKFETFVFRFPNKGSDSLNSDIVPSEASISKFVFKWQVFVR